MYAYRARPTCVATASCVPSSPEHRKYVAAILRSTTSRICAAAESSTQSLSTSFAAAPKCTRPRATCVVVASYTTNYPRRDAVAVDCSEKTDSRVVWAKLLSILFNGRPSSNKGYQSCNANAQKYKWFTKTEAIIKINMVCPIYNCSAVIRETVFKMLKQSLFKLFGN